MGLVFDSWLWEAFALLTVAFTVAYLYATRHFNYWTERGAPYIKPLPFLGNVKDLFLLKFSSGGFLMDIYQRMPGKPYVGFFIFDRCFRQFPCWCRCTSGISTESNIVINYLTEQLTADLPLYEDDIVLDGEPCEEVEAVFEIRRAISEANGLRISREKTEYVCATRTRRPAQHCLPYRRKVQVPRISRHN